MQSLTLPFTHRVIIWNMIGNHNATNLKEASVFLRIIEKIRLTDEEQRDSQFVVADGQYQWRLPDPSYGTKDIQLENEEAKSLATALESASPIRVADAAWLEDVVAKLTHPMLELVTNHQ